ncbi:MAG TPA: phosphatase RsbU N-terminal domain-containing protein [Microlunatus sp.]|nr:phosphatase RsbU N-terminal domain-containing protein [Microlunatus sp.]
MTPADRVLRDYRAAFHGHLLHRDESSRRRAYEIGRHSLEDGISMLELVRIHHEVFGQVLVASGGRDTDDVVERASEFFLEVLAPYHMTQRATEPD